MLIKVLFLAALAAAVIAVFVAVQRPDFRIARTATMHAQPGVIFALVNDFHRWDVWSPWEELDPAMKKTYEGAPAGLGAVYLWQGNSKAGEGRMTIAESRPVDLIRINLHFSRPFAADNVSEFTFQPQGMDTVVTWTMTGKKNFVMKAVHLVMNIDKLVGADFERGLAQLRGAAEKSPGNS